jgi:hypothetical protein
MNEVYFFCESCKIYIDAGYRHAAMALVGCGVIEGDLLGRERPFADVDIRKVLACAAYWDQAGKPDDLSRRLVRVREFLVEHATHVVAFGDIHRLLNNSDAVWTDWLSEDGEDDPTPRYLAERLHFGKWSEVETYIAGRRRSPWWWNHPNSATRAEAKRKFETMVGTTNP